MSKEFDIGLWLENSPKPTAREKLLAEADRQLGDEKYVDFAVPTEERIGIKNPLKVMRDKVIPDSGEGENRFVHYPDMGLLIGRVKDDYEVPGSPASYYCARVFNPPEGVPLIERKYESRRQRHEATAGFIIALISGSKESIDSADFTTEQLRIAVGLPEGDTGIRGAGQELDYFTRQMNQCDAPEEWQGWLFKYKDDNYRIQQSQTADAARSAGVEERSEGIHGRAVGCSWAIVKLGGVEIVFDIRSNAQITA